VHPRLGVGGDLARRCSMPPCGCCPLGGVAGAFALLGAHLLFAMQLLVYARAITVLIVFGVMLLEDEAHERLPRILRYRSSDTVQAATDFVLYYYSGMQHVIGGGRRPPDDAGGCWGRSRRQRIPGSGRPASEGRHSSPVTT